MGLFEFKIRQFSKIMKWADMQVVCSQCLLRQNHRRISQRSNVCRRIQILKTSNLGTE